MRFIQGAIVSILTITNIMQLRCLGIDANNFSLIGVHE